MRRAVLWRIVSVAQIGFIGLFRLADDEFDRSIVVFGSGSRYRDGNFAGPSPAGRRAGPVSPMCRVKGYPVPRFVTLHRLIRCGTLFRRAAGLSALTVLCAIPALSQQPGARQQPSGNTAAPPQAGAAAPQDPGAAAPAGGQPAPARRAAPEIDAGELPEPQIETTPEGPQLPENFKPPAAKPELMTLRNPLMTDAEIQKELGELRKLPGRGIDGIIRSGELNAANRDAMQRWAKLQFARMTAVDDWRKVSDIARVDVLLNVRNAASLQTNENRERDFRSALAEALVQAAKEVLPNNNYYVRMQAARILSQLNLKERPVSGRGNPVSYVPAMEPLVEVLENPDQPEPLKVIAAAGVARIADYADLMDANLKFRAGDALTKEIARNGTHPWYQMRLAEALAALELDFDRNRQPIVITALLGVIQDENRHCLARSAAAKALGRTPIPAGQFDENVAAGALLKLSHDMALAYNKSPNDVVWYECFWNLYVTFKPNAGEDVARIPTSSLLRRGSLPAPLEDVLQRVTPVVKHVLNQEPAQRHRAIPAELIQQLQPAAAGG